MVVNKEWKAIVDSLPEGLWCHLQLTAGADCVERLQRYSEHHLLQRTGKDLSMDFCSQLEDRDMPLVRGFQGIEDLRIQYCSNLTDQGMGDAITACPQLRSLSLYWNPDLTAKTISMVCASGVAANLTHINLSGVRHLHDDAIVELVAHCPKLVSLDLTRLDALRDASLVAVGKHCPALKTLILYACANFTDAGLEAIGAGCPSLEKVDLTGSHSIHDRGLVKLAHKCPQIYWLNLMWCMHFTDTTLRALATSNQKLQYLSVHGNQQVTLMAI
jgi:F-box/leucine-rich repeat protein 2/20